MALQANYSNISLYAAAQIAGINAANAGGAPTVAAFLGARAPIVQNHFPAGWLNTIRVRVMPVLPAPNLDRLWQDMAYPSWNSFKIGCNATSLFLFHVLQLFSNPLPPNIVGITYDDVIYLTPAHQHDLSTIIHELVHTLQWNQFGPAGFLNRYLYGLTLQLAPLIPPAPIPPGPIPPIPPAIPVAVVQQIMAAYPNNPAEARAYFYQGQFTAAAIAAGVNLTPVIYNQLQANPAAPLFAPMIANLTGLAGIGINAGNATIGMPAPQP